MKYLCSWIPKGDPFSLRSLGEHYRKTGILSHGCGYLPILPLLNKIIIITIIAMIIHGDYELQGGIATQKGANLRSRRRRRRRRRGSACLCQCFPLHSCYTTSCFVTIIVIVIVIVIVIDHIAIVIIAGSYIGRAPCHHSLYFVIVGLLHSHHILQPVYQLVEIIFHHHHCTGVSCSQ